MNKLVKIGLAVAIILVVPKLIAKVMLPSKAGMTNTEIMAVLEKQAAEINSKTPQRIDPVTTMTKVEVDGAKYRVHYTMDAAAGVSEDKRSVYQEAAKRQVCSMPVKGLASSGVTFEYVYTYGNAQNMVLSVPTSSCI